MFQSQFTHLTKLLKSKIIRLFVLLALLNNLSGCTYLIVKTAATDLPTGTIVDDMWLEQKTDYTLTQALPSNAEIAVGSYDRTVMVVGVVPTVSIQRKESELLEENNLIKGYYNLTVVNPYPPSVSVVEDYALTKLVETNMIGEIDPLKFKILAFNHVVYLMGYANAQDHRMALKVASHTAGVVSVVDAIKPYPIYPTAPVQYIPT